MTELAPNSPASTPRRVVLTLNPRRPEAVEVAAQFVARVAPAGITCVVEAPWVGVLNSRVPEATVEDLDTLPADAEVELLVVFGGDGTILRGAEWAMPRGVPLLGVNLGHVGFLAELEPSDTTSLADCVVEHRYHIERRLVLDVSVTSATGGVWRSFAVNEVSVEKSARERMVEVLASIDQRPVSRWHCDGVLVSTPTGSTAYAFSAGGPVVWPDVEAMLVVPLSAHALFARPMVLSPRSVVQLDLSSSPSESAVVWCDGARSIDVTRDSQVRVQRGPDDLLIARLGEQPFATRLVKKFNLPVEGWRHRESDADAESNADAGADSDAGPDSTTRTTAVTGATTRAVPDAH